MVGQWAKIGQRRELYKRILSGEDELWGEYVRLWKEIKQLEASGLE